MLHDMYPWAHVMTSYLGQWLPGDRRGFRSRAHRIHSNGNYKFSGGPDEHRALREHAEKLSSVKVILTIPQCRTLVGSMAKKFMEMEIPVAIIAAAATHCHVLIKVGDEDAKPIMGRAKQAGSHALRRQLPGRIWGQSSEVVRVCGFLHFASVFWYVKEHSDQGAALWWDPEIEQKCEEHHPAARQAERIARLKPMMPEGWVIW
jgi:hypothetical protein